MRCDLYLPPPCASTRKEKEKTTVTPGPSARTRRCFRKGGGGYKRVVRGTRRWTRIVRDSLQCVMHIVQRAQRAALCSVQCVQGAQQTVHSAKPAAPSDVVNSCCFQWPCDVQIFLPLKRSMGLHAKACARQLGATGIPRAAKFPPHETFHGETIPVQNFPPPCRL